MIPPRIKTKAARDLELTHAGFRLLCCLVDDRIQKAAELEDEFTLPWPTVAKWLGCEEKASYGAIFDLCFTGYLVKRGLRGSPAKQVYCFGPSSLQKEGASSPKKEGASSPQRGGTSSPGKGGCLTSNPFGKKADGKEECVAAVAAGTLEREGTAEGAAVAGPEERTLALGPALAEWRKTQGL